MVTEVHQLINCVQRKNSAEGTQQSLPWRLHKLLPHPFLVTLVWALHTGSKCSDLDRIQNKAHQDKNSIVYFLINFWVHLKQLQEQYWYSS